MTTYTSSRRLRADETILAPAPSVRPGDRVLLNGTAWLVDSVDKHGVRIARDGRNLSVPRYHGIWVEVWIEGSTAETLASLRCITEDGQP